MITQISNVNIEHNVFDYNQNKVDMPLNNEDVNYIKNMINSGFKHGELILDIPSNKLVSQSFSGSWKINE